MWKNENEKEGEDVGAQPTPTTMATYNAAVDNFTKSATTFLEQLHHLNRAREAYQQAVTASAELRSILDLGDQTLRALMGELEQAITVHAPALDRKRPEAPKFEAIKGNGESTRATAAFP
jgi:exonuclease VII small subunit